MRAKLLAFLCVIAAAQRSFVEPAPAQGGNHQNGERSFEKSLGTHQYDTERDSAPSIDEEVKELERLKPAGKNVHHHAQTDGIPMSESMSVMKSHSSLYTNLNGKQEGKAETKEEIMKNGEPYAKFHQKYETNRGDNSPTPETNVITAVDIPSRGVHKVYRQNHPDNSNIFSVLNIPEPMPSKRNGEYSLMDQSGPMMGSPMKPSTVQASPKDIAEYVFWTGDEKSVTSAIEDYMDAGLMSREEAITLLEDIKLYMGDIQDHYEHEKLKHQLKFSRINEIPQSSLGNFQFSNLKRNNDFDNSDLNQIRQQLLRSNNKKRTFLSNLNQPKFTINSNSKGSDNPYEKFSGEDDYEDLMERLKVADLMYKEYSLEDIIYQLAKVMFSQSLSHGNSEAQEALQKFTTFLENEVEQGRISRSLEKKVIDVLIASLSDTLNEHPEYLSAARGDGVHSERFGPYNSIPQMPISSMNTDEDFRRNIFKPAMKKRNIQSSGILDSNISKNYKKSSNK